MYRSYNKLNEASSYDTIYSNADAIEALGEVDVFDEKSKGFIKMPADNIIKVISDAIYKMQRDYTYLYQFFKKCKVMYIPVFPSEISDTMAVDNDNNLWINLSFVYNQCEMNSDLAFGILFHELFHIFLDHLLRFNKLYSKELFNGMSPNLFKRANSKANICMDYEVNSSMVEDGIVDADYWKKMNGCYKKKYTGMTWEEIWKLYGDEEYDNWLAKNGFTVSELEKKILEAVENASKILLDPESDEDDKKWARKELEKTLDKLLGRQKSGEETLQDYFDDLAKTKLADNGDIAIDLDDISEDLNHDLSKMSKQELDRTLEDMDKLIDDIEKNAQDIGDQFNKSAEEVAQDAKKARKDVKDAMKKLNEGGLTKEEKRDLADKIKDAMEDIISDEVEKEKLKKKREERDAKREAERIEKLKKSHPCRKLIIVMTNLIELYHIPQKNGSGTVDLISQKTMEILTKCIEDLDPLTAKKFDEFKKSDLKDISKHLDELKESLLPDLVELINNETILQKTEDDMKELLDSVFEYIFNAFRRIFDPALDDDAKGSLMKMAAQKLRIVGKILKTQKKWKVGEDFKKAYIDEIKRLMKIRKDGGDEALMKELIDLGVINPRMLDEKGEELYKKIMGSLPNDYDEEDSDYEDEDEEDVDDDNPYEGTMYYRVFDVDAMGVGVELSNRREYLQDHDYNRFALKFQQDFPEYELEEEMESVFTVYYGKSKKQPTTKELEEKLRNHPDYERGSWDEE